MLHMALKDARRHLRRDDELLKSPDDTATALSGSTETQAEEELRMEAGRQLHADRRLTAPAECKLSPREESPMLSLDAHSAVETSHVPTLLSSEGSAAAEAQRKSEQRAMIQVMRSSAQQQRSAQVCDMQS